ncbi:MAG: aminotransferase-like domain-containing protein [Gemmatimonadota bacterium]
MARRAAGLAASLPARPDARSIAFDSGHAFPGVLPDLTRECAAALTTYRPETLQYAPRPGLDDLRAEIVRFMASDGTTVVPEQVLVTNGAKHAIELICRLLLDEGDAIVVTTPTYFTAIPIFRSFGVEFVEVPQDEHGLHVDHLGEMLKARAAAGARAPKFVYNVPDFHNPTGVTMTVARRRDLLALAGDHGLFIVEDSPYRKVRFEGSSVPSVASLDEHGRVFHVGTFSKLMAPGLRVGWVTASAELIARMIQLKSDGGSCPLTQRLIVEFLRGGRLKAHIAQVQTTYRANRDAMVAAIGEEIPDARMDVPHGGYYLWLTLPDGVDATDVARVAADRGVIVIPGSRFFARSDLPHPANHLRVAYSHATSEEITEGVRRLAAAYHTIAAGERTAFVS